MEKITFVGREEELSIIDRVSKQLQLGEPIPIVNVHGEIGLGKTSLLTEIVRKSPGIFPGHFVQSVFMPKTPDEYFKEVALSIALRFGCEFPRLGMILYRLSCLRNLQRPKIEEVFNFRNFTLAQDEDDLYTDVKIFYRELIGKDFFRRFLGYDEKELITLIPVAFGADIDAMISANSLRGFILAIDDADDLFLFPYSWLISMTQKSHRLLLFMATESPIVLENIHLIETTAFKKGDFYSFLRKRGLSVDFSTKDIDFDNTMLRVPFWTNLFAENFINGKLPQDGQAISHETIGNAFWDNLDEKHQKLLALLFLIPNCSIGKVESIIGDFDLYKIRAVVTHSQDDIALSKAFVSFIGQKLRDNPNLRMFLKEVSISGKIQSPALDAVNDAHDATNELVSNVFLDIFLQKHDFVDVFVEHLDCILRILPLVPFWEFLLHRYREIHFTDEIIHEGIEKKEVKGISNKINDGISEISVFLNHGEYRAAKDEYDNLSRYLANISTHSLGGMNRRFLRCLLSYTAINIYRKMGATEKMLSEYDSLKIYWHRLFELLPESLKSGMLILESHIDIDKLRALIELKGEGLFDYIEHLSEKQEKLQKDVLYEFFQWRLNCLNAKYHNQHQSSLRTLPIIQKARQQLYTFLNKAKINARRKMVLVSGAGIDFAQMISSLNDINAFNLYIDEVIATVKSVEDTVLEDDPELLLLLGKANSILGDFLFNKSKYVEAYSKLSIANGLFHRYEEFKGEDGQVVALLSESYYLSGRTSERLRNFKNAQELFTAAERYTRILLKNPENEEYLMTRLGMIVLRKARSLEVLGMQEEALEALEAGIRIYELLLKTGTSDRAELLYNIGQAQVFKVTTAKMPPRDSLNTLDQALEHLTESVSIGFERSYSLMEHIGAIALSIYNETIDDNNYNDAFRATLIAGNTAYYTGNAKLINNTIELILQWENFPLRPEYYQMLKDLELKLKE